VTHDAVAQSRRRRGGIIKVKLTPPTLSRSTMRRGGRVEGGLRLVSPVTCQVEDSELPYKVTMLVGAQHGGLVCQWLRLQQRRGGPPVGTDALRQVTVEAYLDEVRRRLAAHPLLLLSPVAGEPGAFKPLTEEQRRPLLHTLPQVAFLYREALCSTDPSIAKAPTAYVARRLGYSRGHAARLVSQARDQGLLGEARGRRPGEVPLRRRNRKEDSS
jgi:hypothetical protein